jgi:hypothetical protein
MGNRGIGENTKHIYKMSHAFLVNGMASSEISQYKCDVMTPSGQES